MTRIIPLIRAASITPIATWLHRNGRDVGSRLRAAGLGDYALDDPLRPLPLRHVGALMRDLARAEGPDVFCRIVRAGSIFELARLGEVALSAHTPREGLTRIAAVIPHHCTHEHFALSAPSGDMLVREYWSHLFDDETLHLVQQYVAALIHALCAMTGAPTPLFARIAMTPHPDYGLDHLVGHFGAALAPATGRELEILIPAFVADHAFPANARQRPQRPPPEWRALAGEGGFIISAHTAIAAILGATNINMEQVAEAAGMSTRTLQRRLAANGVTFSALVEQVRKDEAMRALRVDGASFGEIAARLGYANQSTLTRAVRRWTGATPTRLRREGLDAN